MEKASGGSSLESTRTDEDEDEHDWDMEGRLNPELGGLMYLRQGAQHLQELKAHLVFP
jgi:hypothetical protein